MKILVVGQHYWPEPFYLSDVCEELAARGHQVQVVTGVPNYPMGQVYPEYRGGKNRRQERNGVKICRTFTIARRSGALFRLLNYYSFSLSSARFVKTLPGEYDVVFTNQTSPVMMVRAAETYAGKWNKRCVLYCMDVWPACLTAGGIGEKSVIFRFFDGVSKKLYRRADRILYSSRRFREYLAGRHGVPEERMTYFPQYAPARFDTLPEPEPKETVDLLFAGNVGAAQKLDTMLRSAALLQKEPEIDRLLRWHIVGDGSALESLKRLAEELGVRHITFHGRRPEEEMPRYYAMADALVLCLTADPLISLTLPGKMQTYMAAGKPILASAGGAAAELLEEADCGFCAPAEDPQGFADAVKRFLACGEKETLGRRARRYYEEHFTRQRFMDELERILREAAGER